ncbi:MAG: hypothetical protein ABT15_22865 [Pseudonocardia sp. SCN 73-27]|nr:MAG: hypothetical protein ABS80_01230 [Pseudonocardia sp. SCN 72-51]ODV03475.1 MAG: hypothetical protein ABT15_22865 [Pseudonocardia sp. SCN 73-27]
MRGLRRSSTLGREATRDLLCFGSRPRSGWDDLPQVVATAVDRVDPCIDRDAQCATGELFALPRGRFRRLVDVAMIERWQRLAPYLIP